MATLIVLLIASSVLISGSKKISKTDPLTRGSVFLFKVVNSFVLRKFHNSYSKKVEDISNIFLMLLL